MAPMECPGSDRIAAYIDGRVDVSEEVRVLEHCSECDDCRRELALVVKLRKEPSEPMPAELRTRVLRAVERDRLPPRAPRSLRRERKPGSGHVAAAAALLLAAAVLMLIRLEPWNRPVESPVAKEPERLPVPPPPAPEPEPVVPVPAPVPAPPVPIEKPVKPVAPPPKPVIPKPVEVPEVREPVPPPGEPLPVKPLPGKTEVKKPVPVEHSVATRTFAELEVSDFSGSITVRRKGTRKTETLSGVARLSEGDVVTAKKAASFHVQGRHPVVLGDRTSVSMAYVPEEQAPYLRLHAGEAMIDSTGPSRWVVSDGSVAVVVKQARARFAAMPQKKGLSVLALSEPLFVQPDGGKVYPVPPGRELRVGKDSAEVGALPADVSRKKNAHFEASRPQEKTVFYTSCDPRDGNRDHVYVEEGRYFNDQALLSATAADRSARVILRPNPRFNWDHGLVLRFRIRTNAQKVQVVMPVAEKRFSFVKAVPLKRNQLNRWTSVEIPFSDFTWRDEGGNPRMVWTSDKFDSIRFEAQQQDVFGDQRGAFLVDDLQVVKINKE